MTADRFSHAERLKREWESYVRKWWLYRRICFSVAGLGLLLIFLGAFWPVAFWPGVGVLAIAVGGMIAWHNFGLREKAHWELLSAERRREFDDR